MLYKFDILFTKELANGGLKTLSYSQLLDNPKAFGENETLEGATGSLSLVKEGAEKGFSLSSLLLKYNSLFLEKLSCSTTNGNQHKLQFSFDDPEDVTSIKATFIDENGISYPLKAEKQIIEEAEPWSHKGTDSFKMIIILKGYVLATNQPEMEETLTKGEVGIIMDTPSQLNLSSDGTEYFVFTLD